MVENEHVQKDVLKSGKVDTIISEPIGVMLLHERMVRPPFSLLVYVQADRQVESFILARDLFLKPSGQMLPSAGHIFFSPFTDEALFNETDQKVSLHICHG
jgi:histone-arginine methyltransferase CARM1